MEVLVVGHFIEELLREAVYTEKNSCDFYQLAARMVSDATTKEVFSQLALEGLEYARIFLTLYFGSEFARTDILQESSEPEDPVYNEMLQSVSADRREERALEMAL